jgi:hypothetical protein
MSELLPGDTPVMCSACDWRGDFREAVMPLDRAPMCPVCSEPVRQGGEQRPHFDLWSDLADK